MATQRQFESSASNLILEPGPLFAAAMRAQGLALEPPGSPWEPPRRFGRILRDRREKKRGRTRHPPSPAHRLDGKGWAGSFSPALLRGQAPFLPPACAGQEQAAQCGAAAAGGTAPPRIGPGPGPASGGETPRSDWKNDRRVQRARPLRCFASSIRTVPLKGLRLRGEESTARLLGALISPVSLKSKN